MLNNEIFRCIIKNTPLISIDLILKNREGEILLGMRNNEPAKGYYFVPGGRILKDERLEKAFQRISRGELGLALDIDQSRFKGVFEHLYDTNALGEDFSTHYIVLAHEYDVTKQEIAPNDGQHSEMIWMHPAEILTNDLVHENTKAYFR